MFALTNMYNFASKVLPDSWVDGIAKKFLPDDMDGLYDTLGKKDFMGLVEIFAPDLIEGVLPGGKSDGSAKQFSSVFSQLASEERAAMFDVLLETDNETLKNMLAPEEGAKPVFDLGIFEGHEAALSGLAKLKIATDASSGTNEQNVQTGQNGEFAIDKDQAQTVLKLSSYLKGLEPEKQQALREFVAGDSLPSAVESIQNIDTGGVLKIDGAADGIATIGGGLAGGMLGSKILSSVVGMIPGLSNIPFISTIASIVGFVVGISGGAFLGDWAAGKFFNKDKEEPKSAIEEHEEKASPDTEQETVEPTDPALKEKGGLTTEQQKSAAAGTPEETAPAADQKPEDGPKQEQPAQKQEDMFSRPSF